MYCAHALFNECIFVAILNLKLIAIFIRNNYNGITLVLYTFVPTVFIRLCFGSYHLRLTFFVHYDTPDDFTPLEVAKSPDD